MTGEMQQSGDNQDNAANSIEDHRVGVKFIQSKGTGESKKISRAGGISVSMSIRRLLFPLQYFFNSSDNVIR
jgi:hypothetical protein